jgi:methylase of polypeptide subunit release factors
MSKLLINQLSKIKTEEWWQQPNIPNSDYFDHNLILSNDSEFKTNDIVVYYNQKLDGGGTSFGQQYTPVIQQIYNNKKFNSCFEWCSGPGFIGFDLLSSGVCDKLYLADIYAPALHAIDKTIQNLPSRYQNKVHPAKIKGIQDLPNSWRFDLVVSNPPHWNPKFGAMYTEMIRHNRIGTDLDWQIHKEFFSNIGLHLNDDATVLLQEQSYGSGPEMFKSMIEESGLTITDCYWEQDKFHYYYLEIKQK